MLIFDRALILAFLFSSLGASALAASTIQSPSAVRLFPQHTPQAVMDEFESIGCRDAFGGLEQASYESIARRQSALGHYLPVNQTEHRQIFAALSAVPEPKNKENQEARKEYWKALSRVSIGAVLQYANQGASAQDSAFLWEEYALALLHLSKTEWQMSGHQLGPDSYFYWGKEGGFVLWIEKSPEKTLVRGGKINVGAVAEFVGLFNNQPNSEEFHRAAQILRENLWCINCPPDPTL